MSNALFLNTIPVNPPKVKRKIKPRIHKRGTSRGPVYPYKVIIQLKILIPVGTAITIVAAVK